MILLVDVKNWLIRTFIVLISFLCFTISSVSANSINYKEVCHNYSFVDLKIAEETNSSTSQNLKASENVLWVACKTQSDLVAYRSWAISAARNATKGGTSGLKTFGLLTEKFGEGYKSIAVTQGKHLPIQLGQKLNTMSPGSWSKVYEAGILNGSKVETHYFFNSTTGQYVNPFIKSSGWGRPFRGITGY